MSETPAWRQMYDAWEKAVAPGLEEMTASSGFQDILASAAKMNANLAKEMERASRRWLHMWNLPAATDVRSLRRQIADLESELKAVRRAVEADEKPPIRAVS